MKLKKNNSYLFHFLYLAYHLNPLNAALNPIYHLLALLGAHHILHVSRIRVKLCWAQTLLFCTATTYFVSRWTVTSGTAATLPLPPATPLEGDYTNKIHSFNNIIVHAGVIFRIFAHSASWWRSQLRLKREVFPRILIFISLRHHYLG